MAAYPFEAAINAAEFPFVSTLQPRSVMIPGMDAKLRTSQSASATEVSVDNNPQKLPQMLYCENVMPTLQGMQSVGFNLAQAAFGGTSFDEVLTLRSSDERSWKYVPAGGLNYVTIGFGSPWVSVGATILPGPRDVSVGYVNGRTFVLYEHTWLLEWNPAANNFTVITPTGINIADMKSICGSINYLIAVTDNGQVCWSSTDDPTDFTPSETTGAGVQIPVDARGRANCLAPQAGGFLIFNEFNVVAALYSNNAVTPWVFREVKGSGGSSSRRNITFDSGSNKTYLWGSNGLQELTLREASTVFPEVTDFLAGKLFESFNFATNQLTVVRNTPLDVKMAYIAGRFLVLSYGTVPGSYTHALVWDAQYRRWGKMIINHVDCFSGNETPRGAICFLQSNGAVYQALIDYSAGVADFGVIILGRYAISRVSNICSQTVDLEFADAEHNVSIDIIASFDGKTPDKMIRMVEMSHGDTVSQYGFQIEGKNLTYILKGAFDLTSVIIEVTKGARG